MASTPFRGVRISWLITARKRERAASAACASSLARFRDSATRVISSALARLAALVAFSSDSTLPTPM